MPRTIPRKLNPKVRMKYLDILWTSIAELESRDQVKNFFKDLLSETEAIMLSKRILIAKYLLEGQSYNEISSKLKAGSGTIARIHRWLNSGFGGYEKAVKQFEKALSKRKKSAHLKEPSLP